ncbi:hypothetical protein CEXT_544221 [Caerostris extrusa]|uniref:Uncharacterized protein n=1 Tax=Caerostris extrusa TaxID=172846 RepID=A0AAV4WTR2_CAEEX|nr:hypothetical protein CEXT_544221 [Caerostris extrusa]
MRKTQQDLLRNYVPLNIHFRKQTRLFKKVLLAHTRDKVPGVSGLPFCPLGTGNHFSLSAARRNFHSPQVKIDKCTEGSFLFSFCFPDETYIPLFRVLPEFSFARY